MLDNEPGSGRLRLAAASAALVAALFFAAAAAAAGEGWIVSPAMGQTLHAGEVVDLLWTGFDEPVDELEILLTVDREGRFPVRLTEQLDPRARHLLWRVPDLPTPSARLVVRFGRYGREVLAEPSGAFRIVGSARSSLPLPGLANGEWWLGRGSPSAPLGRCGARPTADWRYETSRHLPALARGGHQGAGASERPVEAADTMQRRRIARSAVVPALPRISCGLPQLE